MAERISFGDTLILKGEKLLIDNGTSDGIIKSKNGAVKIEGDLTVTGTTSFSGGVSGPLGGLTDVSSTAATTGQVLKWSGSEWAPGTDDNSGGGSSYTNSDVDTHLNQSNPTSGHVLSWNGSDYSWVAQSGGSSYANSDVDVHLNVSAATTGQLLSWNGTDYAWATDTNTDTTYTAGANVTIDGSNVISATDTNTDTTYTSSDFTHDDLTGFVANEHIDWTQSGAGTIHASNYTDTDTDTTYTAGTNVSISGSNAISVSATPTFDSITTSGLTVTGTGSITLASGNDLSLTATDRVKVTGVTPFKLAVMTRTQRDAISLPENGDMIFLSDTSPLVAKFQGYADGSWVDLH